MTTEQDEKEFEKMKIEHIPDAIARVERGHRLGAKTVGITYAMKLVRHIYTLESRIKELEEIRKYERKFRAESTLEIERLKTRIKELKEGLAEIAEGKGAYNPDRMKHAENTIRDMIEIANKVLEGK